MEMNAVYDSLKTGLKEMKSVGTRIVYLKKLRTTIIDNIPSLERALRSDFNKPEFETVSTEVFGVINEIDHFIKHLKKWAKPKRVCTNLMNFPSIGYINKDPIGIVYIASPWNYPFNLTFTPLVGAIGAGNTVILRPSSSTSETSKVIERICHDTFPSNIVYVATGGHDVADKILELDLDMVFFTGSVRVGREIYEKAAAHLSRVVLELGGKSPVIVLDDADIEKAAKRITWGKFINGGQTCIAPDYLIIDKKVKERFISALKKYINDFYYIDGNLTDNFPHIINDRSYLRLKSLLGSNVIIGGETNDEHRIIHPTVIDDVKFDDKIMEEEIFGPILPIITIENESEIYSIIEHNSNPLATYVFTKNIKRAKNIISNINFGGGCINDVVMHLTTDKLPFGGIKTSGLLAYHGYESFKVFSHFKSVLVKSASKEINIKYPPYNEKKTKITRKVGKF